MFQAPAPLFVLQVEAEVGMIAILCLRVGDLSIWEVREEIRAIRQAGRLVVASEEAEELAPAGVEEVAIEVRHNFMEALRHTIQT